MEHFENLTWLFTCDSRNRGIIRQGFNEAALLWRAVKATSGDILEIGRNLGGSTVLLSGAATGRGIYSIDLKALERQECKDYLRRPENDGRVRLLIRDSRQPLPNLTFGLLFVDGDHTFEGVLADVVAHWNTVRGSADYPPLIAFHDAVPNTNFKWRDGHRMIHRMLIRFKNRFRKKQKPEVAPDYARGVFCVCQSLVQLGIASEWGVAGSMLVLCKLIDLPIDFAKQCRELAPTFIAETECP